MKWTIGTVNYKTEMYLPWKLKMMYECENNNDFHYIIIDNNPIHDKVFFDLLKQKYPNIKVIPFDPTPYMPIPTQSNRFWGKETSGEHSTALNVILEEAKKNRSEYLMVYDPDFFWVQRKILPWFEQQFKKEDYYVIGAPDSIGRPNPFGSAYQLKYLNDVDFSSGFFEEIRSIEHDRETGWKIREKLAGKKKHLAFTQSYVPPHEKLIGEYSVDNKLEQYFINNIKIAYHLHKGSFEKDLEFTPKSGTRDSDKPPLNWVQIREAYCVKYYYELLNGLCFN